MAMLMLTQGATAQNWPGWRGPSSAGHTAAKNLPLTWDGQTGKGVLWKVPTGGVGYSSPIVWGKTVFVTTSVAGTGSAIPDHHLVAFNLADGRRLWRTRIAPGPSPCQFSEYAAPTPVTDGKAVYAWFASGVIAAVDFRGKLLWRQTRGGEADQNNSPCSSPVLVGDVLVLLCDDAKDNGCLQGLDKKTGKVLWQSKRPREGGCQSSLLTITVKGKAQVVVVGSKRIEGVDPATGKAIWWCNVPCLTTPSPAAGSGRIFAITARHGTGMIVDPGGVGDVTASHVKAFCKEVKVGYASPVIAAGHVYLVQDGGPKLDCWDLKTGKLVYSQELENASQFASPLATADGLLYFASAGKTSIVRAGAKFKLLATNTLSADDAQPRLARGRRRKALVPRLHKPVLHRGKVM